MLPSSASKARLFDLSDSVGSLYGTEDFSLFLYSLIKMYKLTNIVEIGTGTGCSALWIAQALKENGLGRITTFDDGRDWGLVSSAIERKYKVEIDQDVPTNSPRDFMAYMSSSLGLDPYLVFDSRTFDSCKSVFQELVDHSGKLDLIFSDFGHHPVACSDFLIQTLPYVSDFSNIFIDSASTLLPTMLTLEKIITIFNQGQIPASLATLLGTRELDIVMSKVKTSRFSINHIVEAKDRNQNSTCWIKIEPIDVVPYPISRMRMG